MSAARLLAWPMRSISSRRLAPASATRLFPACRRSWKWTPARSVAVTAGIQNPIAKDAVAEQLAGRAGEDQTIRPRLSVRFEVLLEGWQHWCRDDDDTPSSGCLGRG